MGSRRLKREMGYTRLALVAMIGVLITALLPAQAQLSQGYAPPGRLVDIGGRKLHLHCTGKGSPKVILMAGGGAFSIDWSLVQPRITEQTRTCSYDRAGLGWS